MSHAEYVIERTNEMKREWWTGSQWTEDAHDARWYDREPDAAQETHDEASHAVLHKRGVVDD